MAAWVDLTVFQDFVQNTKPADATLAQAAINLGCSKVDELCGPTMAVTVTERVPGAGYKLPLKYRAASLTSITTWPYGVALDVTKYYVEGQILARTDSDWICDDLTVVYTSGASAAPDWAISAACLIGKQWFNSRLRPSTTDPTTLTGFLVPNQAKEIMADHMLAPDDFS